MNSSNIVSRVVSCVLSRSSSALLLTILAGCAVRLEAAPLAAADSRGVVTPDAAAGESVQKDARSPRPWRTLSAADQADFDRGYAVFNTHWGAANPSAGGSGGSGPLYNAHSCSACHDAQGRGRALGEGPAPSALVLELGQILADGSPTRGTPEYGFVLNTAAAPGFTPEGNVSIRYDSRVVSLPDGTHATLRVPHYRIDNLSGPKLPEQMILMPRMPPAVMGDGMLERVPGAELERLAQEQSRAGGAVHGHVAYVTLAETASAGVRPLAAMGCDTAAAMLAIAASVNQGTGAPQNGSGGTQPASGTSPGTPAASGVSPNPADATTSGQRPVGRFGWQANESSVESQTAQLFARVMGLSTPVVSKNDCGAEDRACQQVPTGGSPEVDAAQFNAIVKFERLDSVPVQALPDLGSTGARAFSSAGCAECHRVSLPVLPESALAGSGDGSAANSIHAFTDLLLHDLGPELADHDVAGNAVHSEWRTAPLWGMNAAVVGGRPLSLLHDGRARSIEEAILWHDGEAREAKLKFMNLSAAERRSLVEWVSGL